MQNAQLFMSIDQSDKLEAQILLWGDKQWTGEGCSTRRVDIIT